jgi:hypothetical protein
MVTKKTKLTENDMEQSLKVFEFLASQTSGLYTRRFTNDLDKLMLGNAIRNIFHSLTRTFVDGRCSVAEEVEDGTYIEA